MQLDFSALHKDLLSMGARVEEMIHRAVAQLSSPDVGESRKLIEIDNEIDKWDVRIEDACLKVLALHQPVAIDLRRITTVMKISGELERVGDISCNIAERACGMLENPPIGIPDQVPIMAEKAVDMLHRSIDAYVDLNSELAREICAEDDQVDDMNRELITQLIARMHKAPQDLDSLMHLFSAVRQIERVGDHATNIAEDVVYLVEGRIIRHATSLERDS